MKSIKKVIYIIIGLIAVSCIILISFKYMERRNAYNQKIEQLLIEKEKKAYKERLEREAKEKELKAWADALNLYEKIKNQQKIDLLVISNDVDSMEVREGEGDMNFSQEPPWLVEFVDLLESLSNAKVNVEYYNMKNASVAELWITGKHFKDQGSVDLAVINWGKGLQAQDVSDFGLFYESFVRSLKKSFADVEIMTVVNTGENVSRKRLVDLELINKLYNFPLIKTGNNDAYLVSSQLIKTIETGVNDIKGQYSLPQPHYEVSLVSQLNENVEIYDSVGVQQTGDILVNYHDTGTIEYDTDRRYVFLSYFMQPFGGTLNIYVNDQLEKTIDTYAEDYIMETIVVDERPGDKRIKLELVGDILSGQTVMYYKIYTN